MKSRILVFIQFFSIFLMIIPLFFYSNHSIVGYFFVIIGIIIGIIALINNPPSNINIRPDIKPNCSLITHGIYKYIRHPMYSSVIFSMFGILLLHFSLFEIIVYLILLSNMIIKMLYEEKLWCNSKEYQEYSKKTKRLIPFVF